MSQPRPDPADLFERRLDGLLPPEDAAAADRAIAADPELQRQAAAQSRIDDDLRRLFAPPAAPPAALFTPAPRRRPIYMLAASLALAAALGWLAWALWLSPFAGSASGPFAAAVRDVYRHELGRGFKPAFVCSTDEQFMRFTRSRLGVPLLVEPAPGLALLGWGYEPDLLGPLTTTLYADVEGERVLVVMDKASEDPARAPGRFGDFHVHHRELAGVSLYEVTRSPAPRVVNRFFEPDPSIVPPPEEPQQLRDDL